jgi:hypothetical protein
MRVIITCFFVIIVLMVMGNRNALHSLKTMNDPFEKSCFTLKRPSTSIIIANITNELRPAAENGGQRVRRIKVTTEMR